MKAKNLLKSYVPRHYRLGVCCSVPDLPNFQEIREDIPVVDDNGSTVYSTTVLKRVPAEDVMSRYKASAFRLSAMVESGVPLKVVNVNNSSSVTIDKLYNICKDIDFADKYVQRVMAQQKERESWFQPANDVVDSVNSDNLNS